MKAIFELRNVQSRWSPPFDKKVDENEVEVEQGKAFGELLPGVDGSPSVFTLVKLDDSKALVEFSNLLTLKGHEHPGNRRVWITKNEGTSFTYLWGSNGITKTLRLKGVQPGFEQPEPAEAESEQASDQPAAEDDSEIMRPVIQQLSTEAEAQPNVA
ncbi:MAG: hypothetical protein HY394_06405 [Candidatus Diapherotrites archaeon]|nr:hypothetical protein [Candidatus Diapherotrites archaeon]